MREMCTVGAEACLPDSVGDTACALAVPKHEVVSLRYLVDDPNAVHTQMARYWIHDE